MISIAQGLPACQIQASFEKASSGPILRCVDGRELLSALPAHPRGAAHANRPIPDAGPHGVVAHDANRLCASGMVLCFYRAVDFGLRGFISSEGLG